MLQQRMISLPLSSQEIKCPVWVEWTLGLLYQIRKIWPHVWICHNIKCSNGEDLHQLLISCCRNFKVPSNICTLRTLSTQKLKSCDGDAIIDRLSFLDCHITITRWWLHELQILDFVVKSSTCWISSYCFSAIFSAVNLCEGGYRWFSTHSGNVMIFQKSHHHYSQDIACVAAAVEKEDKRWFGLRI